MEVDGRCKFLKKYWCFFVFFFWLQRKKKLAFLVISVGVFEDCDDLYVSPMVQQFSCRFLSMFLLQGFVWIEVPRAPNSVASARTKNPWNGFLNTYGQ